MLSGLRPTRGEPMKSKVASINMPPASSVSPKPTTCRCLKMGAPSVLGPTAGARSKEGRRKVMLWSGEPWEQVDDLGIDSTPPGRFVSGVTQTSLGEAAVIGVCVPWFGGHGLRPDASWNPRCSGKTMNNIWPVSPKFSHQPHEEWAASGPSRLSSADPPVSRAIP